MSNRRTKRLHSCLLHIKLNINVYLSITNMTMLMEKYVTMQLKGVMRALRLVWWSIILNRKRFLTSHTKISKSKLCGCCQHYICECCPLQPVRIRILTWLLAIGCFLYVDKNSSAFFSLWVLDILQVSCLQLLLGCNFQNHILFPHYIKHIWVTKCMG